MAVTSSESREPSASRVSRAPPPATSTTSSKMKKFKLVHFVSFMALCIVVTGLYESWQSQKSMVQALFVDHYLSLGGGTEYSVTDGISGSAGAGTSEKGKVSGSDSGTAAAAAASSDNDSDTTERKKWKKQHTRNRTATLLRQRQQKHHNQNQNQRAAEQEQQEQQQQQQQQKKHKQPDKPLNIVLFYADDWTMKTLGTLNKNVKTPVLDELAAQGVLFTNNCVTTSICWISRATMVTGQTAGQHGHLKIAQQVMFEHDKWNQTLFPTLKRAGYWTGFVGKWHAPSPPEHMKHAFDYRKFYYGLHWEKRGGVRRHVTDLNRQDAIQFLRDRPKKKQKFALTVSFFATHAVDGEQYPDQYQPMPESAPWYPNATTVIPNPVTNTQQHWDDLPWFFENRNEGRRRWENRYDTPERYQVSMKNYYRMASEVDHACGEIIQELKAQGVYDNTLIIFTTDNGNFHGEHGMSDKWYAFEESIKVPLIIKDPRMPVAQQGTTNGEFTLNIDLAPTVLSAANVPVPTVMQGRDMAPLYMKHESTAAAASWRKDFFYEWTQGDHNAIGHNEYYHIPAVFALIQKEYKYIYWPQTKYEQLYNYAQDPFEEYDIFNATAQTNQQLLVDMKARYAHLKNMSQNGHAV